MAEEIKEEIQKQTADTQTEDSAEVTKTEESTDNVQAAETPKKNGKLLFYIAIACTALGGIFFGLTFTPLGVYSLLASILFCLVSLSLLDTQKKKENFKGVFILTIVTYSLMGIFLIILIGGVIWSSLA